VDNCFLTLLVIAGLLFLTSCSSAETKACEAAREARDVYFAQYESPKGGDAYDAIVALQNSKQVVWNNQDCFTPEEVIEAQNWLRIKPK
jgi:hypothetical protein